MWHSHKIVSGHPFNVSLFLCTLFRTPNYSMGSTVFVIKITSPFCFLATGKRKKGSFQSRLANCFAIFRPLPAACLFAWLLLLLLRRRRRRRRLRDN
jgi:hypothetical protein